MTKMILILVIITVILFTVGKVFVKDTQQFDKQSSFPQNIDPFIDSPKEVRECMRNIIGDKNLSDLQNKVRPANEQDKEASKTCLTKYYKPPENKGSFWPFSKKVKIYSKQVANDQPITLTGNQILEISDTHYIQKNDITLKDNAKLVIKNSSFEHRGDHSFQYWLYAWDNSQVIVENSQIISSPWLNWNFYNSSSLTLNNVDQNKSNIWHYFPDNSKVAVKNSRFAGTLANDAQADIDGSKETFVELVLLPGSEVDESLPKIINEEYIFPNQNDKLTSKMKLKLKNSTAPNWGITVTENDKITIRDTENLTITFSFGYVFVNETIELSDLKVKKYADTSWNFKNTSLRLINTKTNKWSPIVGGENTLVIKNSQLADNAFSNGQAKIIIEDSTAQFLRAKDEVQMTIKNTEVEGDVIAQDNSKVTLINTRVGGKKVTQGNGKIIEQ